MLSDSSKPQIMLGGLSIEAFLRDYWQKKPLFVKNALPNVGDLITADELAGLSLESDIESRIIQEHPNNQWTLEQGPFDGDSFAALGEEHWTLIVQAVDQHLPEFSQFLEAFKFIPTWRLDDIMITYATDKGSVGPHYDYYDVFLIQLSGKRNWQIGQQCTDSEPVLPNLPVKILEQFNATDSWDVEPGDLLYLPPGLAHHGIASGECMTLSVGFRAPSNKDLLSAYTDFQLDCLPDNQRYADPFLTPQNNTGWVSKDALAQIKHQLLASLEDDNALQAWFGSYISQTKYSDSTPQEAQDLTVDDLLLSCREGIAFHRDETCRIVFTGSDCNNPEHLFINGDKFNFPETAKTLILLLSNHRTLLPEVLQKELTYNANQHFFLSLVRQGFFYANDTCS